MDLPVIVILAGGLGTRLRSAANGVPKALTVVNGRPFIARQIELLSAAGFRRAVICAGFRGDQIVDCVKDGQGFGLSVQYSFDGPELLGTGGAIRQALSLLGGHFFVIYGDSFLDCDYQEVYREFRRQNKPALMTVFRNEGRWDSSNVLFSDGNILAYSKTNRAGDMRHIDYGLGVFQKEVFEQLPGGEVFDLAVVYERLLQRAQLAASEITKRFYEIGTPQGLEDLARHLRTREVSQ